jgi:hypothetical protein
MPFVADLPCFSSVSRVEPFRSREELRNKTALSLQNVVSPESSISLAYGGHYAEKFYFSIPRNSYVRWFGRGQGASYPQAGNPAVLRDGSEGSGYMRLRPGESHVPKRRLVPRIRKLLFARLRRVQSARGRKIAIKFAA